MDGKSVNFERALRLRVYKTLNLVLFIAWTYHQN